MRFSTMAKAGFGVIKGRLGGKPAPLFVILSVTNRCLSKCKYCRIPNRGQRELTADEIKSLIDQAVDMGTQRLGIWGGEPLVRDDVCDIIDYAVSKGLYVTVDTNGYLVPEKIEQLKNLPHLIISLDGPEEAHDANREPGSFRKAMAAFEAASKTNIKLWSITVLTRHNCNPESIDYLLDMADKYRFTTTYQLLHHGGNFGDSVTLKPPDEVYKDTIRYLIQKKKEGRRIGTSYRTFNFLLNWKDFSIYRIPEKRDGRECWGGKFFANVDTDGKVYPCSLLVEQVESKNFLEVGFKKAYESIPELPCHQCLATCYTEYNYLFDMDSSTIFEWVNAFMRR